MWNDAKLQLLSCMYIYIYIYTEYKRPPSNKMASNSVQAWQVVFVLGLMLQSLSLIQAEDVHSQCANLTASPPLAPFIQPLSIPERIDVSNGVPLTLGAYKISQNVHPDLPNTTFYGFGTSQETATTPGPTLEAMAHVTSFVSFENHITDSEHIFTVDRTIHWANPRNGGVPISIHLHGQDTESKYDGHPEAWFTAAGDTGPAFVTVNNTYVNEQPSSLLWYHDHTMGMTRLNVAAGLMGLYLIRDLQNEPPFLPQGMYEIPLVLQDRQFFPNGSINFPDIGFMPTAHPNWCSDYFGDVVLVNGKAWPYLNILPKVYRFRILNGANARFFNLFFSDDRIKFVQIGTDGGFLWQPITLQNITLAPAYRVDVIVDFRFVPVGSCLYLNNSDTDPANPIADTLKYVMKFNIVKRIKGMPRQRKVVVPSSFFPTPDVSKLAKGALYRNVTLNAILAPTDITFLLNNHHWSEPATETPNLYTTEVWDITHLILGGVHPVHIHLVNFLMIHKQHFNISRLQAGDCVLQLPYPDPKSCFIDEPLPPSPAEIGWKDTIAVEAGTVTRLVLPFFPRSGGVYTFDPTTFPGYVWHCHNLDHEDNDMMRPLLIQPPLSF